MTDLYIGLISGTSMDGIDAVVARFEDRGASIHSSATFPFPPGIRETLDRLRRDPHHFPAATLARLDAELGDLFAESALQLIRQNGLSPADIRAIGSHGQTVLHRTGPNDQPPHTLQIADPHRIAARTGIATVADFRRADLAAGGQGAPLAPLIHQALLSAKGENRVVVNLGGIANLTWLPASGPISGFDTGPANCFLDAWYRLHHQDRFDHRGDWAAQGQVDAALLEQLMSDPYFQLPAPKSTGIEYFSIDWLNQRLPGWARERPADIQATLAELSARSLSQAIGRSGPTPSRILVCGGGVHNRNLLERISALIECPVETTARFGLDPDVVEAVLFAWLARTHMAGHKLDTRSVTGATSLIQAGAVFHPPAPAC